jgi:hypothetical protein
MISAVYDCQQPGKHIYLLKLLVTGKDMAQYYEGKQLQISIWPEWNEKGFNSRK